MECCSPRPPLIGYATEGVGLGVSELQSTYSGHAGAGWRERGKKLTLLASLSAGAKRTGLWTCMQEGQQGPKGSRGTVPKDSGGQSKDPQRF